MERPLEPERRDEARESEPELDRRGVLRGLAGFGLVAAAGTLGQSLLLRSAAAQHGGKVYTTTASNSATHSATDVMQIPGPVPQWGTSQPPSSGTYTTVTVLPGTFTYVSTITSGPPPQTVSLFHTVDCSYSPMPTVTQTWSWNGDSFTVINSCTPSTFSRTYTLTQSYTYTVTTPTDPGMAAQPPFELPGALGDPSTPATEGRAVETLDLPGADLFDPRSRHRGGFVPSLVPQALV